jgi:thiol-disulfide isomerase/thioredoxin
MTRYLAVLVMLGLAARPTFAGPDKSSLALEILKKANAAAEGLTAISYEAEFYPEGDFVNQISTLSGRVLAKRNPNGREHLIFIEGSTAEPGSNQPAPFKLASDGESAYSLDYEAKVFISGKLGQTMRIAHPLFQAKFLHASPFSEEIESNTAEFQGVQEVGGVACNVVSVKLKGPQAQSSRLFFGKDDYLLRRLEASLRVRILPGEPASAGRLIFTVTGLNPRPEIDDSLFHLECPKGFQDRPLNTPQPLGSFGLLPIGSNAPDWELETPDGRTVTLKSLRGKVVLLDFWATWCGPCKMAMPGLQRLHKRFKGKPVAIYGVNCRESRRNADPMAYIKRAGFTYPQLLHGDAVAIAYRVGGIPCFYIIGADGKILDAVGGFNPRMEELAARIIEGALKP